MSVVQMTAEQITAEANWPMPSIKAGDQIIWRPQWNDERNQALGFVNRVSARSIELLVMSGGSWKLWDNVLHKDDPRLIHNIHMQQNGAWDYSDLDKRVRALEEQLGVNVTVADSGPSSVTKSGKK